MYEEYQNQIEEIEIESKKEPPKRKKEKSGWLWAVSYAVIFGLVSGICFQGVQLAGSHFFSKSDKKVENTQISTVATSKVSKQEVQSEVADITKRVMPSVVSITNLSVQQVEDFFGGIRQRQSESAGSGIIIGKTENELLMVTNHHVIEGSDKLTVSFIDESSVEANVKGVDAERDLAVLAVDLSKLKEETLRKIAVATLGDSNELQVGETAIAIGNALGYGQSVTTGIVSALDRRLEGFDSRLIQTDAAINPGNSGGALLNGKGEVIGINTIKVGKVTVEGMGYAIPISDAGEIIQGLMKQKTKTLVSEQERGYLGIQGVDVSKESGDRYQIPVGIYVSGVIDGSGAEEAGLVKGMIITQIGGVKVSEMSELKKQLQYYKVGEQVEVVAQVQNKSGEYEGKTFQVELRKEK